MPCEICRDHLNGNGHCFSFGCPNRQPENETPKKKPKPRAAIKPISDKQRKLYQATKKARLGPIKNKQVCDFCLMHNAEDTHEITAGAHRQDAMKDVRALMWVCRECHDIVQAMPYEEQIAVVVKSVVAAVNRCCDRRAVCVADVVRQLRN